MGGFLADLKLTELDKFKKNIRAWKADKGEKDKSFVKSYAKDRKDLTRVLKLTQKGSFKEALEYLEDLDTIVRDEVPRAVYNFLYDRYHQ